MEGSDLIKKMEHLVLRALKNSPDGLTNAEVDEKVQLNLKIPNHRGYITWTILQHLIQCAKVERVGKKYKPL